MRTLIIFFAIAAFPFQLAFAAESNKNLKIAAVGVDASPPFQGNGILAGRRPLIATVADFHEFTCPLNPDGGLLTALVDAALSKVTRETDYSVVFESGPQAHDTVFENASVSMAFPFYKPNCEGGSYLTDHTKSLCENHVWSEPIHEMFVGYFSLSSYDRPVRKHEDVFGASLCLPGKEFPEMLHEVGISSLNAKLIYGHSPAECLKAVVLGDADLTLLPESIAALEIEHLGLEGVISAHYSLDRLMTLHAVAPKGSPSAIADIELLNLGLQKIKEDGSWFEIIVKFADGHDHEHAYDKRALSGVIGEASD